MSSNKKKNEISGLKLGFIVIFSFVIGGIMTISILKFTPILSSIVDTSNPTAVTTIRGQNTVYDKSSLAAAVDNVYDAVVTVEGYQGEQPYSTGTGFIYKKDDKHGYIMTNQHVVADCDSVKILLSSDEEIEAKVLGGDEYLDIAIISIAKDKVSQVVTIGSTDQLKLGDTIFTVGSPVGSDYRGSVTAGILSGKDRMVSVGVTNSNSNDWVMKVLQVDAALNPGNSGGPLVNAKGEVIGVTSMKLVKDEIEGMGFAIPIEIAMAHVSELEAGKKIDWPMLGISMSNVSDAAYNRIQVDKNITEGVVVAGISENSGASKSELKVGDVITKLNGEKIKDTAYLRYELYKNKPGDTIELTYIRDGKEHTAKVTLTKK